MITMKLRKILPYINKRVKKEEKDTTEDNPSSLTRESALVNNPRYRPECLDELCARTKFTRKELQIIYRGFKQECPSGMVKEDTFKEIYAQFFPQGDSNHYAHYVFNVFDRDRDGTVSFEEFVCGLSILARGSMREKLSWAFQLYDLDGDGYISRDDLTLLVRSVYDLIGLCTDPPVDENTARDHVEQIFKKMDFDRDGLISSQEFMDSCSADENIQNSMNVFDTVL